MIKNYGLLAVLLLLTLAKAYAQRPEPGTKLDGHSLFRPVPRDSLRELHPDRPGVTESPFTIDPGHFQLEADAVRLITGRPNTERIRQWNVGHTTLKLGITDQTDVQLVLETYTAEKQRSPDLPPTRQRGFGDLSLRVKRNLFGDDNETRAAMALTGFVRLPTGGTLGSGRPEAGVVLPLNYHLTDKWELTTQLEGDWLYDREEAARYFQLVPALTAEYNVSEKFGVFTELITYWHVGQNSWETTLNVGPELRLGENVQLDLGTFIPLNRRTDHEYFLGLTFRR